MQGHRIGYVRVSTIDQNTARQLEGIQVDKVFEDHCSGKNTKRPNLELLLHGYLREGDTLVVHSGDRLARSLVDVIKIVETLTMRGITVEFVKEHLTFTGNDSPTSRLMLSIIGAISEWERAMIRERQAEGIAIAKNAGVYKGRKPKFTEEQTEELRLRLQNRKPGETVKSIAAEFGVTRQTAYTYLRGKPKSTVKMLAKAHTWDAGQLILDAAINHLSEYLGSDDADDEAIDLMMNLRHGRPEPPEEVAA